jgi:hypothetical protein
MRASPLLRTSIVSAILAAGLGLGAREARAESLIKQPGNHIKYKAELEPHLDLAFLRWYGAGPKGFGGGKAVGNPEFGAGFRASIPVGGPLFIPKINDSIAITFGVDLTGCPSYCADHVIFRAPVGVQWNFWFTRELSAFADLGGIVGGSAGGFRADFFAMVGGRYLFSDKTSVTLRIGYPFVSLGVSFFVG